MSQLFRFSSAIRRDPAIEVEVMRDCGDDVRELLHDGHPTAYLLTFQQAAA